jgi:hypothetical protein
MFTFLIGKEKNILLLEKRIFKMPEVIITVNDIFEMEKCLRDTCVQCNNSRRAKCLEINRIIGDLKKYVEIRRKKDESSK